MYDAGGPFKSSAPALIVEGPLHLLGKLSCTPVAELSSFLDVSSFLEQSWAPNGRIHGHEHGEILRFPRTRRPLCLRVCARVADD